MASPGSHNGRKFLFFLAIFVAFFTFTADIVDLREELLVLSCSANCLDNNITTGMVSAIVFKDLPMVASVILQQRESLKISFLHLLSFGLRAPPRSS